VRQITSTLVVAPHLGALVGLVGTLRELTARRCRVHVSVLEDPPPGIDVSAFASPIRRMTFGRLPALDHWSHLSATVRGVLDCWRWLDPEKRDERSFERALAEAPPLAARLARNRALRSDILRRPVTRLLGLIHDAIPAPAPVRHFLEAHRPGILMVAPMFGVGSIAPDYLRAANELGIPSVALPLCWDDLDARAWPHVIPDCLALWNREQRRQAVQTLGVPARRTAIVGGGCHSTLPVRSRTRASPFAIVMVWIRRARWCCSTWVSQGQVVRQPCVNASSVFVPVLTLACVVRR
jgi:hypothetical protein